MNYEFFLASALEKVFPGQRPKAMEQGARLSAWRGTKAGVQLVYFLDGCEVRAAQTFHIETEGAPSAAVMRSVGLVPSDFPCYENADDEYITKEPGLFPDLLEPMREPQIRPLPRQYRSVWLSWDIPEDARPGDYAVTITAVPDAVNGEASGVPVFKNQFVLSVGKADLPPQTLIHTEWFHTDCLAHYYGMEVFSGEYWRIVENFIRAAGTEHGINMLLTPVFTPPLDTEVGSERLTVQLVDVAFDGENYSFGFEKLKRWTELCRKYGIEYLEIPHLFTQWGAYATPKVIAPVDGRMRRIFGWDVPATSPAYRKFLEALLPALRAELKTLGYDDEHVYYHISDEPSLKHLESYLAAKGQVEDLLEGCQVIDALSNVEFYRQGIVKQPIPSNNHIQEFYDAKVPDLWVYYCCGQGYQVPNRFFAMKSARNRIMGVLMYLYRVKGFLQWGYNFYNSQLSKRPINPYYVSHADYAFPSGDGYLVYPGEDGTALSSVRAEVQDDALLDLRALNLLESLGGREAVEKVIYENTEIYPMTFTEYPREEEYLLTLRERVAEEIEKYMKMRQYLEDFFELFSYPEESREALRYAYGCIERDSQLKSSFDGLIEGYAADKYCDFRGMLKSMSDISVSAGIHVYEGNMVLLICLSKKLKEYYAEEKIDQQIWYTSMCDLKWKLDECRCVYGIHGTFVPGWYDGFFRMERFGFGKLQFEITSFDEDYQSADITLTPDSRVINVHIPRTGEKLERESQKWAYGEAAKFFREHDHLEKIVFVCHSWLLFPRNREVLSPQSNLYLFLSDYDIAEQGLNDDYSEVWRLFDVNYEGDVDKLPQNTSLRRAYADWIRKGEKTGWGYGVFTGYLSGEEKI